MTATQTAHNIVSREEWLRARKALLAEEKALTRQREELAKNRRRLPWVRVEKTYEFEGPNGPETLADLFAGRSQLIVYHFMFAPTWEEGCRSCSYLSDHVDPMLIHLAHRDVSFAAISRAPIERIGEFRRRMDWRFHWVSSLKSDFNFDYHVSFSKDQIASGGVYYNFEQSAFPLEEGPGVSVFYRDESGDIFHTYSAYARGLDDLVGTYQYLDLVPKGRDEDGLAFSMAWVRHHDRYGEDYKVDSAVLYQTPNDIGSSCCSGGKH